jgi:UDP-N-acetylmuramoylalanine--D-glutamate ligase
MNYSNKLDISFSYFGLDNSSDFKIKKESYEFRNHNYSLVNSKLHGTHNLLNSMASVLAVDSFVEDKSCIQNAITSFQPLPHRLEEFHVHKGIRFINDSKATNTDSVKYALTSFEKPVRIIMGGSDKGEDFTILNPHLKKHVKKIYLIGETIEKMQQAFDGICPIETFSTFRECVQKSYTDSVSGDVILLSPACASYDMFKNYEDRGNRFKAIVRELS